MFTHNYHQERPGVATGPGLTKQSMKDETDINKIMAKYQKSGLVSFVNKHQATYMDAPDIDYNQALNIVVEAQQVFDDMPSSMRKRFNNDPGEFLSFVQNKDNQDEIYDLGLAERPAEMAPQAAVEAVEEPSTVKPT